MKNIMSILGLVVVVLSLSSFTNSSTAPDILQWERLGSKTVNFKLDRDVIKVGAREGTFSKLKVVVTKGSLNMHKMRVEYMNGESENITLRHQFDRRSSSRVIDIDGRKRFIKNIVFWYDTKNNSRSKAVVTVFGK